MKRELAKRLERLERVIPRDKLNFHSSSNDHSPVGSPGGTSAIDLVALEKLCMLHCTDQEIASYFGVTTERIEQERQCSGGKFWDKGRKLRLPIGPSR